MTRADWVALGLSLGVVGAVALTRRSTFSLSHLGPTARREDTTDLPLGSLVEARGMRLANGRPASEKSDQIDFVVLYEKRDGLGPAGETIWYYAGRIQTILGFTFATAPFAQDQIVRVLRRGPAPEEPATRSAAVSR